MSSAGIELALWTCVGLSLRQSVWEEEGLLLVNVLIAIERLPTGLVANAAVEIVEVPVTIALQVRRAVGHRVAPSTRPLFFPALLAYATRDSVD